APPAPHRCARLVSRPLRALARVEPRRASPRRLSRARACDPGRGTRAARREPSDRMVREEQVVRVDALLDLAQPRVALRAEEPLAGGLALAEVEVVPLGI